MALAIDAKATASTHTAGATSLNNANLTVGAGATCLLAVLVFQEEFLVPSGVAVSWDSTGTPQAMTQIIAQNSQDFNGQVQLWGLVNPTAGHKTLHATWTGSVPAVLDAISFSGGVTTSVATAFLNAAANFANGGTPTLSLTGASGNISVCAYDDIFNSTTGLTATSSTLWFTDNTESNLHVRAATAPSASTVTWTGAPTSNEWVMAGVDVVAGAASDITGDLALTTDDATLSAAGTVLVSGALSKTTAAAALSAAGTVRVSGGLTKTTGAATLSSAGTVLVSGGLAKTLDAVTISAAGTVGFPVITGSLSATTAPATLSAAGTVLVSGTLSKTLAAAAISAAGHVLVSGTLSKALAGAALSSAGTVLVSSVLTETLAPATLSATGTVVSGAPITGTLVVTLQNAVMFQPVLPANRTQLIQAPPPYIPTPMPLLPSGLGPYAQREYEKIGRSLNALVLLTPQGANAEPKTLMDGMVRMSRAPWRPLVGQTDDAWVFYDGPSQTWKPFPP